MRIRIKYRKRTDSRFVKRLKNKARIRKKVFGTAERPRLSIFRSGRHIYCQLIDDESGKTVASASTLNTKVDGSTKSTEAAKAIGAALAKKASEKNVSNVVFDRSGYLYHGRVKALADGAREGGLNF